MACNALQMGALLRQWLYPDATDAAVECHIDRIRYRPASRCTVQYELNVNGPGDAPHRALVAASLYCDARKFRHLHRQMQQLASRIGEGAKPSSPCYQEMAKTGMLLQRFPFDARLPEIWSSDRLLEDTLDPWFVSQLGARQWEVKSRRLDPVRWRTGLSAVQRYRLGLQRRDNGDQLQHEFLVKIRKRHTNVNESGSDYLDLWLSSRAGKLAFRVPELWLRYPQAQLMVYEPIDDPPLPILLRGGSACGDHGRLIAAGIASLHNSDLLPGVQLYTVDFIARYTRCALALATIMPEHATPLRRVVKALNHILVETLRVPVHGDFKPDHALIRGQHLTLLDMDPPVRADPMTDLARMATRLIHADLLYRAPPALGEGVAREMLRSYCVHAPFQSHDTFPGHYAGEVLSIAEHIFQHQVHEWRARCAQLIREAELAVTGRLDLPLIRQARRKAGPVEEARPIAVNGSPNDDAERS